MSLPKTAEPLLAKVEQVELAKRVKANRRGDAIAVRRERARIFGGYDSRPESWSLHPVAIGATAEVTKPSKPSRQRAAWGGSASRQAATRMNAVRAPRQPDVGADPVALRGRPPSWETEG